LALDAPRLAEQLKQLRHRLREAIDALGVPSGHLLAARDTTGDVGTALATEAEMHRPDAAAVAQAAFRRLSEALRCLEEYGKTLNAEAAQAIEALRYRGYELELAAFRLPRRRLSDARLYVILSRPGATPDELRAIARDALAGGADVLQLRQKDAPLADVLALARELRPLAHEHDALLLINDRPDVALLAGADGVHLGNDDLPVRAARRLLGPDAVLGATANTVDGAQAAEEAGADYLGCGAMFPSLTRPDREVVGPARCAEVQAAVRIPVFAIGGIEASHLDELAAAGVERLAVSHAICAADDVAVATRLFRTQLPSGPDA
jgi:thiamine-phosphate pyrophosphorylase